VSSFIYTGYRINLRRCVGQNFLLTIKRQDQMYKEETISISGECSSGAPTSLLYHGNEWL
jgi:hypothetical protein